MKVDVAVVVVFTRLDGWPRLPTTVCWTWRYIYKVGTWSWPISRHRR